MFKFPWNAEPEPVNIETIELRRRKYEEYAVYVTDEAARRAIMRGLNRVSALLKDGDPVKAKSHIEGVKHAYAMARHRNMVLKYRTTFGSCLVFAQLVLLCMVFWIGINEFFTDSASTDYKIFLSIIGGGLGGIALVILGLLGIQIQTTATIHRNVWYTLKPVSGCIMGLISYLAVEVVTQTVTGGASGVSSAATATTARPFSAFLIGFLGGFFETFANRALLRAAKIDESPGSMHGAETGSSTAIEPASGAKSSHDRR